MSRYQDELRAYAAATEPTRGFQRRGSPRPVLPIVALAAGLLLVLRGTPTEPVSATFAASGAADLGDAVHVTWDGAGHATGDSRAMELGWDAGEIAVEVEPGRGVALSVVTGEAVIRVIGTGFDVRRDALGTEVSVRHGVVSVTCAEQAERRLEAGARVECEPVAPAALLGRARAQLRRGDPPDVVLATIRRARLSATGEVASELDVLDATELARAGRPEEALAVADAALPAATNRRIELLRLATRLAFDLGGCTRAGSYAAVLAAAGEPTPCPTEP